MRYITVSRYLQQHLSSLWETWQVLSSPPLLKLLAASRGCGVKAGRTGEGAGGRGLGNTDRGGFCGLFAECEARRWDGLRCVSLDWTAGCGVWLKQS